MKNKFMRSVTAMVVAVTMLISSQGVVTSFADGGDHSDKSESSSVQMNEVGNNGTNQPTENGTVEDAAVKDVVEMINALPAVETITEETDLVSLKDQVNAAHAAYDALSDDQKAAFDAATLEKLTALEAKISELESGKQETEPSEAVQNVIEKIDVAVEQIDYTTETISATDGTTVTKTHITMLKDLDPANNAELKALIDKEAAHEQDENQPALTNEEAAQLDAARKAFEDASAKYRSEGFSDAQLAARQAYDALATEEEKAQVTNYSLLEAMEENIAYIMQAVNTLPNGETVAMIGDTEYKTLDEAIANVADGQSIQLLQSDTISNLPLNKDLTFIGTGTITIQNATYNGYNRTLTLDGSGVSLEWYNNNNCNSWLMLGLGGTIDVKNGASLTFKFDSKTTKTNCAIYMNSGAALNVTNGSTFQILGTNTAGITGQGIQLDAPGTASINVTGNSKFLIDGTNRGYVNSPVINVKDSTFTVQNCTSNASNGGKFTAINSTITYQNNAGHGLSARDVILENSTLDCINNGLFGFTYAGNFTMDGASSLTSTGNAKKGGGAGLRASSSSSVSIVKSGAKVNILGNSHNGLENYGDFTFEDGVILRINNNDEVSTNGGGIYNAGSIILPSDTEIMNNHAKQTGGGICNDGTVTVPNGVKLYNNHADIAGDDIHLGSKNEFKNASITFYPVGSDWTLTQTQLPITGWYFDGHKDGTSTKLNTNRWSQGNYYDLANVTANGITLRGFQSLKAAHAYAYDPETPVNPTDWEHSKSKTATNLDSNYQSQVTLSLPAAQEQLVSDVVFVLDKSTSATVEDQMIGMLNSLNQQITETGAKVKVGVVIFNKVANRVLELTELNSDNMGKIQKAIKKDISSGTNTHAGLLAGKAMLDADTSVDANRKYMILVSDGMTYMFDEPARAINSIQATNGENGVMAGNDCWGIRHYQEGGDLFIPEDWTSYLQYVGSKLTELDQYIQPYDNMDKTNYISKGNTELPTTVDVALYKTQEVFKQMQSNGYHCYSVLAQTDITNYPWGPAFMKYLAGGKEVSFDDIKNDIYYLLDAGSQVVDVIGEGIDNVGNEYDFKFIDEADKLTLKVGNEVLPSHEENGYYGFGEKLTSGDYAGHYPYELTYYPEGMGTRSLEVAGELFRWDINVPVSNFAPVQLTYTVQLTHPQTADGTYGQYDAYGSEEYAGLYTNKMAILYPVDSNGVEGEQEAFQKPTVSYSISNGKPVDPPVDPEDPTPRPGGGGDEDDDTPTIINDTPVPTTTIDDEDVPLTDLPEDTVTIDDEEVPLKDIPNTGDMIPVPAIVAAVISIGGIALLMKKHK